MGAPANAAATIERVGEGAFRVTGHLGFASATALYRQGLRMFEGSPRLAIDLAGAERVDSAGLALLVEWTRRARLAGQEIRFLHMPEQLLQIARVSGLEAVLPFANE